MDLTWVLSGPYCTMVLADQGAQVIKVERPELGDASRGTGPFVSPNGPVRSQAEGISAYFMSINRNKQSITLNLAIPRGQELFRSLVRHADVVVENYTPGTMAKWGLDYTNLQDVNPRLIYCAISGFGQTGPYAQRPALDIIVQAMGGIMSITGEPGRGPMRVGASVGDIIAGLFAAVGICAALHERDRSGRGQMLTSACSTARSPPSRTPSPASSPPARSPGPSGPATLPPPPSRPSHQRRLDRRRHLRRQPRPLGPLLLRHRPPRLHRRRALPDRLGPHPPY